MNRACAATETETPTRVLIVEDMPWDGELMRHELVRNRIECVTHRVETESEFREALEEFRPDVILADYNLPRFSGMRAFRIVEELRLDTPVILVSGAVTEEVALHCLQAGIADYLMKDNLLRLGPAVKTALESTRMRQARRKAEEERQLLATAVDQAAEAVVITDADAKIQYVNPAFELVTGYTRDEVIGGTPRILQSGQHDRAFHENLWDTLTRGRVWTGHLTNKKKDGTIFEEDGTISPVPMRTGTSSTTWR